jgi:hypothetical protein
MQTKTLPESQNHGDWRESKSRRPFFRSLLGALGSIAVFGAKLLTSSPSPPSSAKMLARGLDVRPPLHVALPERWLLASL